MKRAFTVGALRPQPAPSSRLGSLRRAVLPPSTRGAVRAPGPPPAAAGASPAAPAKKGCCRSGCEGCPWTEARRHRLGV